MSINLACCAQSGDLIIIPCCNYYDVRINEIIPFQVISKYVFTVDFDTHKQEEIMSFLKLTPNSPLLQEIVTEYKTYVFNSTSYQTFHSTWISLST